METSDAPITSATVYIETSSQLFDRTTEPRFAGGISVTWWDQEWATSSPPRWCWPRRAGDPEAAQRRLAVLERLPLLDVTDAAITLAAALVSGQVLPAQAGLRPRDGVSPDMELCASGQCPVTEPHRTNLSRRGLRPADYLYPRRT